MVQCPGAYGVVKKRCRSDGGATPFSKRLAVDLGSTGIFRDAPGGYGISRRPLPLPPWPEPPSTSVSRGRFDHADHQGVVMAIAPLTDITRVAWSPRSAHAALPPGLCRGRFELVADALAPFTDVTHVFYVAWDPRPTHAAPRGANYILLCNTLNCPKRAQVLVLDPFDPFGRIQLTLHRGSDNRPGSPVAWEGFSDPSVVELVGEHALWAALHEGLNCSDMIIYRWPVLATGYLGKPALQARLGHGDWAPETLSAAAARKSVCDLLFMVASTDSPDWCSVKNCLIKSALGDILTQFYQKSQILHTYKVKMPSCFLLGAKDFWVSVLNRLQYGRPLKERGVDTRNIYFLEDIHGLDKMVKIPDLFSTSGRQTQYLMVLVLIWGFFIPNVKADAGMMCPTQSINDFLPKTPKPTCPVIKLSGVHWSHSKTARNPFTNRYILTNNRVNDLIGYFLENDFTKCTMFQDILFVLEFILLCPVLCQLDQHKQVRFFYLDRTMISLWIDTSLCRIFYHACWSLYGYLLSLSKDVEVKHFGLHTHYINLLGCLISAGVLLLLVARHVKGFKRSTVVLNIATILLSLCCVGAETTRSWYGYAQLGSILFRTTDVKRSICFISPSERAGMWASMRVTMKGQWRLVAATMRRTVATVKRKLRPRGTL
ncbi:uncharacterized protein LOC123443070 isoform X2 [Hordeum vulgare subsp. vulgare]|uniref:uncharacterized protein LOC123443070 isoform X2 n=1 Tax=Hordeum vulgare subsp. vulgare TaxID=112509 RepID=UPI001D1A5428|nr:uncharacterized protein LOC123443070 isoform X2 [Hordeum vulgare subsp. vulgare]